MPEPIGIIYPPPDQREVVDKTARFVAKNGVAFEELIMRNNKGNPKFSFLFANDPFNAYYKHKVREIREVILKEQEAQRENEGQQTETREDDRSHHAEESNIRHTPSNNNTRHEIGTGSNHVRDDTDERDGNHDDEHHKHEPDETGETDSYNESAPRVKPKLGEYMQQISQKPEELEEPPPLTFLANPASFITHLESDIIKLTARYVATFGRDFLLELVSREQGNPHFDFLKPQHGQFPYLTHLIMQYALIQNSPLDILERLREDSSQLKHVLKKIETRAKWNKMLEVERLKREEAEEREKNLYAQIDWHDFVIVEQIDYQYNEVGEYPPTRPDQVGTRLLQQQRKDDQGGPEEMDMDMDMDVESDQEEANNSGDETGAETGFVEPNPPNSSNVIIRRDYDPKMATKVAPEPDNYFVSPITNERIPVDKIHEHVRYNLADPKYLEKKEQMLQGRINEDAVFASGSQIQDSLKNLAERRTDIFGMNDAEAEIGRRIGEEEQDQSKGNKLIWDGHKSSLKKKRLN